VTKFLNDGSRPSEAVVEFLKNLGALKRAQADAHRYLASIWDSVEKQSRDLALWNEETLGKWDFERLANRDFRAPGTGVHDGTGLHGVRLEPISLRDHLDPTVVRKLESSLHVTATDGRPSGHIDGHEIEIMVGVASIHVKKELMKLPEYKNLAVRIRDVRIDSCSVELEPSTRKAHIILATVPLSLDSVGKDASLVLNRICDLVRVTAGILRPPLV